MNFSEDQASKKIIYIKTVLFFTEGGRGVRKSLVLFFGTETSKI